MRPTHLVGSQNYDDRIRGDGTRARERPLKDKKGAAEVVDQWHVSKRRDAISRMVPARGSRGLDFLFFSILPGKETIHPGWIIYRRAGKDSPFRTNFSTLWPIAIIF